MTETDTRDVIDRLDTARIVSDFEVLMRVGSISVVDGRIVRTKLTQQSVAAALGIAGPSLSAIRNGRARPSGNLALAIMGLLNANVNDYLLPLPDGEAAEAA